MYKASLFYPLIAGKKLPDFTHLLAGKQFSMRVLNEARAEVSDAYRTAYLIGSGIWAHIVGDSEFCACLEPITSHELVLNGYLGIMLNSVLITDGFEHPDLRFLRHRQVVIAKHNELFEWEIIADLGDVL
jgi:hypothetical protein